MKTQIVFTLVLINAMLAAALVWRAIEQPAAAQVPPAAPGAARSEYLVVPGKVASIPADVLFVPDTTTNSLGAIAPGNQGNLEGMPGKIDLNQLVNLATEARLKGPANPPRRGRN